MAAVASFELIADVWIRAQVPADQSWEEAAAFVRARIGPNDRIVAAPSWADPIVRFHLGALVTLRSAAPEDSARFDRMWELGIRGESTREDPPVLEQRFGGVRVRMWELAADDVAHDFVDQIAHAKVELVQGDASRPCRWVEAPRGRGGLGQGPMAPDERFVCDPSRPWLWVGPTILADLTLTPRRCIWQHPVGPEPVRSTFFDVPLGDRLVVHGGVDYENERWRAGSPVTLRIWISDRLAGELVHRDGEGWSSLAIETSSLGFDRATVRFEVTTEDPTARVFCWAASTRLTEAADE
ncbi:MAG: hypothetical protein AMJ62_16450 [Myxococcales bacterium SG8_38]|nr:MAG: hypothetical protein AMJ62_16450 [Myxococcales bacterium SG8_38]